MTFRRLSIVLIFSFMLLSLPKAYADPIVAVYPICPPGLSFGVTIQCSIDVNGEVDTYNFTGGVDDRLLLRVNRTSNTLRPWIRVYKPDNNEICGASADKFVEIGCVLPVAGDYTIRIADSAAGTTTGNYTLYMQRLNNPGNAQALTFGQSLVGAISEAAEVDTYTFESNVEDRLFFRMYRTTNTIQPWLRLYNPLGEKICETYAERFIEVGCAIPRTGTYTLIVADASAGRIETGDYLLYMQRLNNPNLDTPITFGKSESGTIAVATEVDTYTFAGNVDDKLIVRVNRLTNAFQPWIRIFRPDGFQLCESYTGKFIETWCTLPSTGHYTILIADASAGRTLVGEYSLFIQRLNNPEKAHTLDAYGQSLLASINLPAKIETYTFPGEVDDQLFFRMYRTTDTVYPWFRLFDPLGNQVCEGYAERFTETFCSLGRKGTYTLIMADASAGRLETGTYSWFMQRLNNPGNTIEIKSGQTIPGGISAPTEVDTYTFTGQVDEAFLLRLKRVSGTAQPWIRVYNPAGNKQCESYGALEARNESCTLPKTGTYTILVADASYSRLEIGDYTLYIKCLSESCKVPSFLY